jgi:GRF zinc finger
VSAVRTVQKAGRNHGKQFFKCSNTSGCTNRSFFVWASAAADHYSLQNIPVYGAAATSSTAAAAGAEVAAPPVAAVPYTQFKRRGPGSSGASPGSKTAAFLANFAGGSGGSSGSSGVGSSGGSSRCRAQQSSHKRSRII